MICCMSRAIAFVLTVVLLASQAEAKSDCPVTLISGAGDPDTIAITFRNIGKLPIRRLDFKCRAVNAKTGRAQSGHCSELNVSFIPGAEYTVSYPYPNGKPVRTLVSLRSVTFSDGHTFKPSKRDPCRELKIIPSPRVK
jgi:hypothetical protein